MTRWIEPRILTDHLERELNNGHYRLTWEEIAIGIFGKKSASCIAALRHAWFRSQKQLRRQGTCAILVTDIYFNTYSARKDPKTPEAIKLCIAGLEGGQAAGVRLLTMKGTCDDPMALMYFHMRGQNIRGTVAAVQDRVDVEQKKGKLSRPAARRISKRIALKPTSQQLKLF